MPSGSESTHLLDGLTVRHGVQLGSGPAARVYLAPPAASYLVSVDGSLVAARGLLANLRDIYSADAGDVVQQCITALGSSGGTILLMPGVYAWGSIPKLTRNLPSTARLRILGSPGTVLTMSDGGRRIFDFDKQVDHDTFRNIEFGGFDVDASPLSSLTGSHRKNHVLIGDNQDGASSGNAFARRFNVDQLWIHDIRVTSIPTDPTLGFHNLGVWIVPYQLAASEGTQNFITNVLIERVRLEGGNQGFVIGGGNEGANPGLNILVDKITLRDCYHDTGTVPTTNWTSSNILIGYHAQVGTVLVDGFYGANCGDAALEIDAPMDARVSNTTIRDAQNGAFYGTNFNNPINADMNRWSYNRCRAEFVNSTQHKIGWKMFITGSVTLGKAELTSCAAYSSTPTILVTDRMIQLSGCKEITVRDFKATIEGFASTAAIGTYRVIESGGGTVGSNTPLRYILDGVDIALQGDLTGGGTISIEPISTSFDMRFSLANITYTDNITALAAGSVKGIQCGYSSSSSQNFGSVIRNYRFLGSVDTTPKAIIVHGTATATITDLRIEDCDFANMAAGGTEVSFAGTSNAANTTITGANWKNAPTSAAWPSLAATTVANTNKFGYPVMVAITAGTVTVITVGTPGGSAQTIATATSATAPVSFYLQPGGQFTITYTVAPTVVYIPVIN